MDVRSKLMQSLAGILDGPMTLPKAITVAVLAHGTSEDKGGNSYIRHPLRVMEQLPTEDEMICGVLHDVVEDTDITLDDLQALGCTKSQLKIIAALSKPKDKTEYDEEKYFEEIEKSPCASRVKYLDMKDNSRLDRLKKPQLDTKDVERMNGYIRNMKRLRAFVVGVG